MVTMSARIGADGRLTGGTWRGHEDARPSTWPRRRPGAGRPHGRITASQLRQLQRAVGPGRELVLVSTFGPQAWEHAVNTALAAAARRGKHTELANWHQAIAARSALLWPDGIHPRPAGARLYARVVLAAIKSGLTGQRPSCPASPRGSA